MSQETCDRCHGQKDSRLWDTARLAKGHAFTPKYARVCTTCYVFLRDNKEELFEAGQATTGVPVLNVEPCPTCGRFHDGPCNLVKVGSSYTIPGVDDAFQGGGKAAGHQVGETETISDDASQPSAQASNEAEAPSIVKYSASQICRFCGAVKDKPGKCRACKKDARKLPKSERTNKPKIEKEIIDRGSQSSPPNVAIEPKTPLRIPDKTIDAEDDVRRPRGSVHFLPGLSALRDTETAAASNEAGSAPQEILDLHDKYKTEVNTAERERDLYAAGLSSAERALQKAKDKLEVMEEILATLTSECAA